MRLSASLKRPTALLDYSIMLIAIILGVGSVLVFAADEKLLRVKMGWTESRSLLWDAALSLAFFVQHSGMVRSQFRERLAGTIPDRYQGAVYTIASGIVLACVAVLWQRTENHVLVLDGILFWITRIVAALALAVLVWGALALRSFDLLGLGPIKAHLRGTPSPLSPFVVRGPYRWVRHPLYFSILVIFWSAPDVTTDRLLLNVLWTGWIIVGTLLEERDLTARFGEEYQEYQRRVPMLIPWHKPMITGD